MPRFAERRSSLAEVKTPGSTTEHGDSATITRLVHIVMSRARESLPAA